MSKITKKLRSKRGASLILAMVFMLMCLFVGGSVLAAATANGGRVADMTSNQQAYLSQRSAALLMADMLEGDGNSPLQLTIKRVETTAKDESGNNLPTTVTYSLPPLQGSATYSSLQRILVENAVQRYQKNARISTETEKSENFFFTGVNGGSLDVQASNRLYDPTNSLYTIAIKDAAGNVIETYTAGSFQITLTDKYDVKIEDLAVIFCSKDPKENTNPNAENFDLYFYFGDNSLVSLYVKATYSEGKPVEVTQNGITTTTTTTVIRWDDPVIEKGGFSS